MLSPKKSMILEMFGKKENQTAFPVEEKKQILHVKSIRESIFVKKNT